MICVSQLRVPENRFHVADTHFLLLYFVSFRLKCPLGTCWVAQSRMFAPCQERTMFQTASEHVATSKVHIY